MVTDSQAILHQSLYEEEDIGTEMGFFSFPPNMVFPQLGSCQQPLRISPTASSVIQDAPPIPITDLARNLLSCTSRNQREGTGSNMGGEFQILSLERSSSNLWGWGGGNEGIREKRGNAEENLRVSAMKMKKTKARRKVREPRFCFKTMSDVDILDDGYKWRKYGQKVVKNTQHPRSYYRCTQDNCRVKKRVERLAEDPRMVITTYEGRHIHSPSPDNEDSQTPSHNFFF